jgi:cell division protein FtsN
MGNFMEQKHTLWIIAAVGIFLLVVLGAALLLYSPTAHSTHTVAAITPVKRPASSGWISAPVIPSEQQHTDEQTASGEETRPVPTVQSDPAGTAAGVTTPPVTHVSDMTVIAQNTTVYGLEKRYQSGEVQPADGSTTIDLNTLKTAPTASGAVVPENETSAKAMETVRQSSDTFTAKPVAEVPVQKTVSKKETSKTVPLKADTIAKKSAGKQTKQPAAAKVKKQTANTQFWVQAAAFTSRKAADNARATLDNNKIPADVFTYTDNKGHVFYRVRIGPYITKSEAEYWRTRIIMIPEFVKNESYITSTVSSN